MGSQRSGSGVVERARPEPLALPPIHQRPDWPDSDVPDDAIRNLRSIALITLTLIATIAHTLEDWADIPSEEDVHYDATFIYVTGGWRTEDTL